MYLFSEGSHVLMLYVIFQIPSIHLDPLEEPIVDIAIGGQNIPNQPQGFVSVWVTTVDGRVSSIRLLH